MEMKREHKEVVVGWEEGVVQLYAAPLFPPPQTPCGGAKRTRLESLGGGDGQLQEHNTH